MAAEETAQEKASAVGDQDHTDCPNRSRDADSAGIRVYRRQAMRKQRAVVYAVLGAFGLMLVASVGYLACFGGKKERQATQGTRAQEDAAHPVPAPKRAVSVPKRAGLADITGCREKEHSHLYATVEETKEKEKKKAEENLATSKDTASRSKPAAEEAGTLGSREKEKEHVMEKAEAEAEKTLTEETEDKDANTSPEKPGEAETSASSQRKESGEEGEHRPQQIIEEGDYSPQQIVEEGDHRPQQIVEEGDYSPQQIVEEGDHSPQQIVEEGDHSPQQIIEEGDHSPQQIIEEGDHRPQQIIEEGDHSPQQISAISREINAFDAWMSSNLNNVLNSSRKYLNILREKIHELLVFLKEEKALFIFLEGPKNPMLTAWIDKKLLKIMMFFDDINDEVSKNLSMIQTHMDNLKEGYKSYLTSIKSLIVQESSCSPSEFCTAANRVLEMVICASRSEEGSSSKECQNRQYKKEKENILKTAQERIHRWIQALSSALAEKEDDDLEEIKCWLETVDNAFSQAYYLYSKGIEEHFEETKKCMHAEICEQLQEQMAQHAESVET